MAADDAAETFMALYYKDGKSVRGESSLDIHQESDWMDDDIKDFFVIDGFSMKLTISPERATQQATDAGLAGKSNAAERTTATQAPERSRGFTGWMDQHVDGSRVSREQDIARKDYSSEFDEISVERQVDLSSARLMEACVQRTKFDSAVIIKRKVTGDRHDASTRRSKSLMTFFRLEIRELMLVSTSWSGGEDLNERLEFLCRAVRPIYLRQSYQGEVMLKDRKSAYWCHPGFLDEFKRRDY